MLMFFPESQVLKGREGGAWGIMKSLGERAFSDSLLGSCPRIVIFSQIKAFLKNKHSHMFDITSIVFSK